MAQSKHYDNDLTIEELMAIAKEEVTTEDYKRITDVGEWILMMNMRPSETERIPIQNVYWAYYKYCKANRIKPLHRLVFGKQLSKRFRMFTNGKVAYYYVEKAQFELSKDEWWQMRKVFRNEKQRSKTKKEKKRRKVSGPQS